MLALHSGVVAHDDVAEMQTLEPVYLQSVAHRGADRVGNEWRHAAGALRHEATGDVRHANGEVIIFVNIWAEGRSLDIRVNLVGRRDQPETDHFQRDRIDGFVGS